MLGRRNVQIDEELNIEEKKLNRRSRKGFRTLNRVHENALDRRILREHTAKKKDNRRKLICPRSISSVGLKQTNMLRQSLDSQETKQTATRRVAESSLLNRN